MIPMRATNGQHPDDVARAVARQVARWMHRPEATMIARAELAPYAPPARDTTGSWVPSALQAWARDQTFYREPSWSAGELVASLPLTVAVGGGDCDDIAAAVATMAAALGFQVAIGRCHPTGHPLYAHIITAISPDWTGRPGAWIVVDPEKTAPSRPLTGTRWHQIPQRGTE